MEAKEDKKEEAKKNEVNKIKIKKKKRPKFVLQNTKNDGERLAKAKYDKKSRRDAKQATRLVKRGNAYKNIGKQLRQENRDAKQSLRSAKASGSSYDKQLKVYNKTKKRLEQYIKNKGPRKKVRARTIDPFTKR